MGDMTTTAQDTNGSPAEHTGEAGTVAASEICDVCPHRLDAHGALDVRFCAATRASVNSRGCICT